MHEKYIFTFDAAAKIAKNFALVPDGEYKPMNNAMRLETAPICVDSATI